MRVVEVVTLATDLWGAPISECLLAFTTPPSTLGLEVKERLREEEEMWRGVLS